MNMFFHSLFVSSLLVFWPRSSLQVPQVAGQEIDVLLLLLLYFKYFSHLHIQEGVANLVINLKVSKNQIRIVSCFFFFF